MFIVSLITQLKKKYYAEIAEFLHRANSGLKNGNFEMDYDDGEIRFKAFVNFENTDISKEVIRDSVIVGPAMINKYGIELLKVMIGAGSPEESILEAETLPEDEEI